MAAPTLFCAPVSGLIECFAFYQRLLALARRGNGNHLEVDILVVISFLEINGNSRLESLPGGWVLINETKRIGERPTTIGKLFFRGKIALAASSGAQYPYAYDY